MWLAGSFSKISPWRNCSGNSYRPAGTIRRTPAFSLGQSSSLLAIGIGSVAAVFAFIEAAFLRSLPVREPHQLAALFNYSPTEGYYSSFPYPDFASYRSRNTVFMGLASHVVIPVNFQSGSERAQEITADLVSVGYFDLLGVPIRRGRGLQDDAYNSGLTEPVVVLSYDFWRRAGGLKCNRRVGECSGLLNAAR